MPPTEPQLQEFSVAIDRNESIRRGIAAPHDVMCFTLDLTQFSPAEREWMACRYRQGWLFRSMSSPHKLAIPYPTPEALIGTIQKLCVEDAETERKQAEAEAARLERIAEAERERVAKEEAEAKQRHNAHLERLSRAEANPALMIDVCGIGLIADMTRDDVVSTGIMRSRSVPAATVIEPQSRVYPERVNPDALASARMLAASISEDIAAGKLKRKEARMQEQRDRLLPHLSELEKEKLERGMLDWLDVEKRLTDHQLVVARAFIGDGYEVSDGWLDKRQATSASDEAFELLKHVECALPNSQPFISRGKITSVNILLTRVDGEKIKACVCYTAEKE